MSMILEGKINGMRPAGGKIKNGKRAGEQWHFLSMEVVDLEFSGQVYSCQVHEKEDQFKDFVQIDPGKGENGNDKLTLKQDWTGHNVKLLIRGLQAGEREIEGKDNEPSQTIIQVRFFIARLKDLGLPKVLDNF